MFKKIILGLMGSLAIGIVACDPQPPQTSRQKGTEVMRDTSRQKGTEVMRDILYFKDARTGLCFAYYYEERGMGECKTGGPAITLVPCESIPATLLITVNETESEQQ